MKRNAASDLVQDENIGATSDLTLVFGDDQHQRACKVIQNFLMFWLENCGIWELEDGGAATWLGPNISTRWKAPPWAGPIVPQGYSCCLFPPGQSSWMIVIFKNYWLPHNEQHLFCKEFSASKSHLDSLGFFKDVFL